MKVFRILEKTALYVDDRSDGFVESCWLGWELCVFVEFNINVGIPNMIALHPVALYIKDHRR